MATGRQKQRRSYVNALRVGFTAFECVLVFAVLDDEDSEPVTVAELVTGPVHAKAFLDALRTAIARYEQQFGLIPEFDEEPH
jgi:hypothetical protein